MRVAILVLAVAASCLPLAVGAQEKEIEELAATIASQITETTTVVAVAKFTNDDGYDDRFSRFLAGRLTTALSAAANRVSPPRFRVVDRLRTEAVLNELGMRYASAFDAKTFTDFGKATGANTIVAGDFRVLSSRIAINGLLLNMKMELIGGKLLNIPRTSDVDALLGSANANPVALAGGSHTNAPPSAPAVNTNTGPKGCQSLPVTQGAWAGIGYYSEWRIDSVLSCPATATTQLMIDFRYSHDSGDGAFHDPRQHPLVMIAGGSPRRMRTLVGGAPSGLRGRNDQFLLFPRQQVRFVVEFEQVLESAVSDALVRYEEDGLTYAPAQIKLRR